MEGDEPSSSSSSDEEYDFEQWLPDVDATQNYDEMRVLLHASLPQSVVGDLRYVQCCALELRRASKLLTNRIPTGT